MNALKQSSPNERPTFFRATMIVMISLGWLAAWHLPWEIIWKLKTCIFRRITSIPCPFCDLTHACVYFARGQILESINSNALGPVIMISSAALMLLFGIQILRRAPAFPLDRYLANHSWIKWAALLLLCLNWCLQIAKDA
jgi:Protein of unknown function (DUF2752)